MCVSPDAAAPSPARAPSLLTAQHAFKFALRTRTRDRVLCSMQAGGRPHGTQLNHASQARV